MPQSKGIWEAIKNYFREWWFTLTIGYAAFAVAVFLFCFMWTATFLGFSHVGDAVFWTGIAMYELVLLGLVFVVAFLGSYRKRKSIDLK